MVGSPAALRPPVQMRRDAFDPVPELAEIRDSVGVQTVVNAFGLPAYLVTRHDDVKAMLSDHERFSNVRPPGQADGNWMANRSGHNSYQPHP